MPYFYKVLKRSSYETNLTNIIDQSLHARHKYGTKHFKTDITVIFCEPLQITRAGNYSTLDRMSRKHSIS